MNPYFIQRGGDPLRQHTYCPTVSLIPEVPASISGRHKHRGGQSQNTNAFKHGLYSKRSPNAIALNMTLAIQRTREATLANAKIKQEVTPSGISITSPRIPRSVETRLQLMEMALLARSANEKATRLKREFNLHKGPRRLHSLATNAGNLTSLYKVKLRSWEQRQLDHLISSFLSTHDLTTDQSAKVRRVLTKTYSKYTGKKLSEHLPSPVGEGSGVRSMASQNFYMPLNLDVFPSPDGTCTPPGVEGSGVTEYPVFSGRFLHDRAWHLIQPHITDLLHAQQVCLKRRSRAVPYPTRFLMDGILWKLATGAKWSELPEPYPLRRCQSLYLQLCRAGLMPHIFRLLHEDLVGYGDTDLETLLQSGRFVLYRNRVLLISRSSPTWQDLIALLLLQCGQKTALRVERLNPPRCSIRRLPGYRPGRRRRPYLRRSTTYKPFVPPTLPKKYTLKGWHIVQIPAPFCHPLHCLKHSPCSLPPRLGEPPRPELSWGLQFNSSECHRR